VHCALLLFLAGWFACAGNSYSQTPNVIENVVEQLIAADEFKADEIAALAALPKSSLTILVRRLEEAPLGSGDDLRIFFCLARKLAQHAPELAAEETNAAISALALKVNDPSKVKANFKRKVLADALPPNLETLFKQAEQERHQGLNTRAASVPAPKSPLPARDFSWAWAAAAIVSASALWFAWSRWRNRSS
jgi:hypothetical protein